jgi:predicted secreted protein
MAHAGRFLIAFLSLLMTTAGWAAERAQFDLIGYSPDGRYFAFEEFGIQDGSGFAYSNIFVIDLSSDSWAAGPFRRVADTEEMTLGSIRTLTESDVAPAIAGLGISVPGVAIALNGDGEPGIDGLTLDFGVPGYSEPGHMFGAYRLALEIFEAPSPLDCVTYLGDLPMGYGLILDTEGSSAEIHRDDAIPQSRGCPTTYRISAVVLPFGAYDLAHAVAMISVYAFGFEGVDRRYLAVPLTPPGM